MTVPANRKIGQAVPAGPRPLPAPLTKGENTPTPPKERNWVVRWVGVPERNIVGTAVPLHGTGWAAAITNKTKPSTSRQLTGHADPERAK